MAEKSQKNNVMDGGGGLGVRPDHIPAIQNVAHLIAAGALDMALEAVERLLVEDPERPALHRLVGQIEVQRKNYERALACFDRVLEIFPRQRETRSDRALVLFKLRRDDELKAYLDELLVDYPDFLHLLKVAGAFYAEIKTYERAERYLRRAHEIDPADIETYVHLGNLLLDTGRPDEAHALIKRGIKIAPRTGQLFAVLAMIFRAKLRFRTVVSCYRHALHLNPDDTQAQSNYGVALLEIGQISQALDHMQSYVAANPSVEGARFNLATTLLLVGRLREGWEAYEARRGITVMRERSLPYPFWNGEDLSGKVLLILSEQGVGDEIWAASMFDDVIPRAERCLIECDARLASLYERSFPNAVIIPRTTHRLDLPCHADYMISGMGLARWLRDDVGKFPGKIPYLFPDSQRKEFIRWRLAQLGSGLRVGISWRSTMQKGVRRDSYTTLDEWGGIFAIPGVTFVNLQYGECSEELDRAEKMFGVTIHNFSDIDLMNGFEDVVALISELDLVISPCNTVGTLGGALSIPTLQFVKSTYWLCLGQDCEPAFPSMKLYFRPWDHDWTGTLHAIANEIQRSCAELDNSGRTRSMADEVEQGLLRQRVARAAWFFHANNLDKTRDICSEILKLRPAHSEARLLAAMVESARGQGQIAEQLLQRLIEDEPLYAEAHNQLGAFYIEKGAFSLAAKYVEAALDLNPSSPESLNNRGVIFAAEGNYPAAIDTYRRAISSFAGFLQSRYNLAMALEDSGQTEAAMTEYEIVVRSDPGHANAWNNLGSLYLKLGRNEDAMRAYRKALDVCPGHSAARRNLGTQLLMSGDVPAAIKHLERLVSENVEDASAANALGIAYARNDQLELAVQEFKRAVSIAPGYIDANRNLGLALQKLGRLEEAREVLLRALSIAKG